MQISIISLFPEMFEALHYGITGRALEKALLSLKFYNPRDYANDKHRRVDDRPYGGGPGMVMRFEPLHQAIRASKQKAPRAKVIHLSPQGKSITHEDIIALSQQDQLILVASRYEGVDERVIEFDIDEQWSVGDYVVSGGELPAMLIIDAITRLLPGALGNALSSQEDSFSDGLLDCPHYTRPPTIEGMSVPAVLQKGDHQSISRFKLKQKLGKTWQKRPDLIKRRILSSHEQKLLDEYRQELLKGKTHE